MESSYPVTMNQDSKNVALLVWIGTIFFSFVPALIVYLIKKDDGYVQDQAREALNFQLTMVIVAVVCFILSWILIGFLLLAIAIVVDLVFVIIAAIAASNGVIYRYPYTLRLIK